MPLKKTFTAKAHFTSIVFLANAWNQKIAPEIWIPSFEGATIAREGTDGG